MTTATFIRGVRIERGGRGGRLYIWKKRQYWSVTSIISGGLPKPVLVNWAKKVTAEYAVENIEQVSAIATKDPKGAIDLVKGAAYRMRDRAAELGSLVHDAAEAHVLGRPYPTYTEAQAPFMEAYKRWISEYRPEFESVEAPVFSNRFNYAGTLDAIATIDGTRWLLDFKTGASGPWPEVGLQLAAYRYAEAFLGMPDDSEPPLPEVDECAVVKIRPLDEGGVTMFPVKADREMHEFFLYCREIFRFSEDVAQGVIGLPWQPSFLLTQQLEQSLEGVAGSGDRRPTVEDRPPSETVDGTGVGPPLDGASSEAPVPSAKPKRPRKKTS